MYGDEIFIFARGSAVGCPIEISSVADIVIDVDNYMIGTIIAKQAYNMGASTIAHISFERHLGMHNMNQRRTAMKETALELGLNWIDLEAPDPALEGIAQTQIYIMENVPRWVDEFGQNTAFFATNCGMQEPLIRQIAQYGGLFPSQCCLSPYHGLPFTFNINREGRENDVEFLLNQLTTAIYEAGATGRISTWPVSFETLSVEVGVLYAFEYLEGRTINRNDPEVLHRIINEVAATYDATATIRNKQKDDGTVIDNYYLILLDFITL